MAFSIIAMIAAAAMIAQKAFAPTGDLMRCPLESHVLLGASKGPKQLLESMGGALGPPKGFLELLWNDCTQHRPSTRLTYFYCYFLRLLLLLLFF